MSLKKKSKEQVLLEKELIDDKYAHKVQKSKKKYRREKLKLNECLAEYEEESAVNR